MVLKSSSDMLFSQISLVYLSYVWASSVLSPKMRRSWDSKPSQDPRPQLRALKGPCCGSRSKYVEMCRLEGSRFSCLV